MFEVKSYYQVKMGKLSYLVICNGVSSKVQIDWEKISEEKVAPIPDLKRCEAAIPDYQPDTISELAEELDETKLFGYLTNDYIEALQEVCLASSYEPPLSKDITDVELQAKRPRIYFEEEGYDCLHYLEFHPGTTTVYKGTHDWSERDIQMGFPDYPSDDSDKEALETYHLARKMTKSIIFTKLIEEGDDWRRTLLVPFNPVEDSSVLLSLFKEYGIDPEDPTAEEQMNRFVNAAKAAGVQLKDLLDD